jgi:hypothetical protein
VEDEESRSKDAELIKKLQDRAEKAERAEQQYKQEVQAIQLDLDKARQDQTAAEERDFQRQTDLDQLKAEINELKRLNRELDRQHSEDEQLLQREQEKHQNQLLQQQSTISRLNEALRLNGIERQNANRGVVLTDTQAHDTTATGDSSVPASQNANFAHLLQQKEETINSLQMEVAEASLKLAQLEHEHVSRQQDLERNVSEYRVTVARLQEENESFVTLLSEKTMKGEIGFSSHDSSHREPLGMSSLAEELESSGEVEDETGEEQTEAYKRLEADNKKLKAEVDRQQLYIAKIIQRILSHPGFEQIMDKDDSDPPPPPAKGAGEKALPAIPDQQAPVAPTFFSGMLQRTRSLANRPGAKARPMSYAQPAAAVPTANENPDTAPSIPLNRGHRRARSDQAQTDMAAAAVVQQMNRASPMRTVSGSPLSPSIRPLSPSQGQGSYFGASSTSATRVPSGSGNRNSSSANSVTSDGHSEEQRSNTDGSSIAPQVAGDRPAQSNIPGAVMKQNQLRPLRLVQGQTAVEDEAAKAAKRGSIFGNLGWFRGSSIESQDD